MPFQQHRATDNLPQGRPGKQETPPQDKLLKELPGVDRANIHTDRRVVVPGHKAITPLRVAKSGVKGDQEILAQASQERARLAFHVQKRRRAGIFSAQPANLHCRSSVRMI